MPAGSTDRQHAFAESRLAAREYGLILVQLLLLVMVTWQFRLEEKRHFLAAIALASGGFAVHALLPAKFRRGWFLAISLGAVVLVLGPVQSGYAVAVAALLIGAAWLPVPLILRMPLIITIAAGLVWLRNGSGAMFWPIVGSMFMFRLIVYLHSSRRERQRASLSETCSYFLLLPNAFFPLFPVVDYSTFRETYYNDERRRVYQTGIHWLVVGVGHLLLYRLIKQNLLPSPLEIRTLTDTALFLAANYALYVRVSGQFHIICGMLHLFGFNLPRTHDFYFLASSFSDIWRRINIYWKDFLMKTFFFPAFFRARALGNLPGVALAVVWVFLWTWLGHSWQTFWLLGDFPLRVQDAQLWLGVGLLVAVNSMLDYRRAMRPRPKGFQLLGAIRHSLQVLGVFVCVSLFWAYWTMGKEVVGMLTYALTASPVTTADVLTLGGSVLLAILVGTFAQYWNHRASRPNVNLPPEPRTMFDRSVSRHLAALTAILLVAQGPVHEWLGPRLSKVIADVQTDKLSRSESLAVIAGYYEELNDNSLQSGPFLGDPRPRRSAAAVDFGDLIQYRDGLLGHELIPNWKGSWYGAPITINRWGMRDKDRSITKPKDTVRIALVGSSVVMGFGVGDEQTFARLLEERLNADPPTPHHYEVLNFGVGRFSPLHRRLHIEKKVLPFQPDLILYFAHQDEFYSSASRLGTAAYHGVSPEDPCLEDLIRRVVPEDRSSEAMVMGSLQGHHAEILTCIYRRMRDSCQRAHARLLVAYLPIPGEHDLPFDPRICLKIAEEAGLDTVDLGRWWGRHTPDEVLLGDRDYHPNPLGHRLLATRLDDVLRQRPKLLTPSE